MLKLQYDALSTTFVDAIQPCDFDNSNRVSVRTVTHVGEELVCAQSIAMNSMQDIKAHMKLGFTLRGERL